MVIPFLFFANEFRKRFFLNAFVFGLKYIDFSYICLPKKSFIYD